MSLCSTQGGPSQQTHIEHFAVEYVYGTCCFNRKRSSNVSLRKTRRFLMFCKTSQKMTFFQHSLLTHF
jgi:hypothetical protein